MTRTRRADSADPAHETVDSTKQLKDTKRHLPGKSKLPRAKKSGRIPEEDHDHLLAKTKKYAPPPAHHASGVHVETSKDPKHDIVPPKMRASTSPRRSPRLAAGATQLVQPNRTAKAIRGYRDEDARSRAAGGPRVARNEGEGTGYFHRRCVEPRGVSYRGAIRPNVRKKPGVVVFLLSSFQYRATV